MIVELIIELLNNIISMYVLAPPKERALSFGSRFHRGKKTPTKEEESTADGRRLLCGQRKETPSEISVMDFSTMSAVS